MNETYAQALRDMDRAIAEANRSRQSPCQAICDRNSLIALLQAQLDALRELGD